MKIKFEDNQSSKQTKMEQQQQQQVAYEMFIPFLYRGKDKDATERRVFWVFKQLNWGYIKEVQVFGFDDEKKKSVTARVSFSRMNATAKDLVEQLDAGETAQVHYEQGKPWFWNVVKYTRREKKEPQEPQVTFKIKVKTTTEKPTSPAPSQEFKPQVSVKPQANVNKFKILDVDATSSSSETEESK
jgi:hypothetical protein